MGETRWDRSICRIVLGCDIAQKKPEDYECPDENAEGYESFYQALSPLGIEVPVRSRPITARPAWCEVCSGGFPNIKAMAASTAAVRMLAKHPMNRVKRVIPL
ncbi:MAG TPA: hypothetical protein VGR47_21745 [Terracidiphilus sp.]|nr:hypothetical protein [Terracidiphilus sp.]